MLLSLIAIKIIEFAKMVIEAIQVESYKTYFRELHEALKLEFAEVQIVQAMRNELHTIQERFGFLQKEIEAEVTALAPIADKAVAVAIELRDKVKSSTSDERGEYMESPLREEHVIVS